MHILNISTERLQIRILMMEDKKDFFSYRSLPEVYKYQSWQPKDIKESEDFINKNDVSNLNIPNKWLQLAICLKTKQLIGDIGIHFLEDKLQVEIGYTLSPLYQGKGYAIEAVKSVVNYLFIQLQKHRIIASVDPDNIKSIKLLEKLGLRKEAHFIKSFQIGDKWYDDCIYAILEEEWT